MKATILDVAKLANVSKATVSRVINNNSSVNDEIKARVLHAIDELGYRPSALARHLASNTSNMIGLILPDITNPFFPVLARGIEDVAHRLGYTLFLCNTDNDPAIEQEYIHKMVQQQVAGIVLISSSFGEDQIQQLVSLKVPFVLSDRWFPDVPFDAVAIDNYKAACEVIDYFIRQGHERICHLAGPTSIQSAEKRKQGYLDTINEANLKPIISHGPFTYESGFQRMASILDEGLPSAVFAANDLIALGAINAIRSRGLRVPEDIAVIGCDDIAFAQMCNPMLSTIAVPVYQIGVTAMELLHERVKGVRAEKKHVILEHRLIKRESCGGEAKQQ